MLQYLIILLDDTSTSYCHYTNNKCERRLISLDNLRAGILFGMKENLMIQFVYPDYDLPQEYKDAIETIDHSNIKPNAKGADVIVLNGIESLAQGLQEECNYVLRISKTEAFAHREEIKNAFGHVRRLNIVLSDVETFTDADFKKYEETLLLWAQELERLFAAGLSPQCNLLTDRMQLEEMNNCGAGDTNITLAPDGRFYLCPAFYLEEDEANYGLGLSKVSIGSLEKGLDIKNPQLLKLSHAPLCRNCDAYQCKRCVWLNRKTTFEVNTPSHEQCVTAHLERNAARELLLAVRRHGQFLTGKEIKEIDYLDPFDVRKEW